MFFVMYFYEEGYHLATRKPFESKEAADKYAKGVHESLKAFVVEAK